MLSRVKALWSVFKAGEEVADSAKWKGRQITVTMIAGLIIALVHLAKVFGYEIPIDSDTATAIAGGVLAIANVVLTLVTSKKIGLRTKQPPVSGDEFSAEEGGQARLSGDGVSEVEHQGIDESTRERAKRWAEQSRGQEVEHDPNFRSGA